MLCVLCPMVITWYGQACFKLQSGATTMVVDPFEKKLGLNPPKFEAQLALITHEHFDHNNVKSIGGAPFVIDCPGEYEVGGVRVKGISSFHDDKEGAERGANTIYVIKMEDVLVAHLGDLGQKQLTEEQLDVLGEVDILMIPVGGTYTIDAETAVEVTNQIGPRIVIPMHYKIPGLKVKLDPVTDFLKEIGQADVQPVEKLTIKQKDLPDVDDKMEVVVFKM